MKIHIGKLLLDKKLITEEQLQAAITEQSTTGEKLGKVLIDLGFIEEDKMLELLSQQLNIPLIDVKNYAIDQNVAHLLPEMYARRHRAILLSKDKDEILVGMADPQDIVAVDHLSNILNGNIKISLVKEDDLLKVLDLTYRQTTKISTLAQELSAELKQNDFDVAKLAVGLSITDAPVAKLLQSIFEDAVQIHASDVHIEPDEHVLRIRQRIDGILHEQVIQEKQISHALTLRLKLMASLNIAEKRIPQDGRFSIKVRNKNFDVRLSTLPVQFGESVVMRLLSQSTDIITLDQMGMEKKILDRVHKIISLPHGLLLITGPTGSGKTTTLYSLLAILNNETKKIITVEDPVEYRLPRINQVQVNSKIDLTFARVLRSVLRQDPDIIMVGEMRDQETVSIAIRAAMTGHFVIATLHTNDAVSSAMRLLDMGAEGYLVASVLRGVIAQRLVRRICKNCSEDYTLTAQEEIWLSFYKNLLPEKLQTKKGHGCTYCHNTGYKGQIGVFELLDLKPEFADALRHNDTSEFEKLIANDTQFETLVMSGLKLVQQGITTVSEIIRITGEMTKTVD